MVEGVSLLEVAKEARMQEVKALVHGVNLVDLMLVAEPEGHFHVVGHLDFPEIILKLLFLFC